MDKLDIYPKYSFLNKKAINSSTCFILMPFKSDFNITYGFITEFLTSMNIECNRADDIYESKPILSLILDKILRSEFIIADLTTKNPNVFYEVGIAHSFRDPENVILISQSIDDIPFDIRHLPIIIYNTSNKYLFESNLKNRINYAREKNRKKNFLIDYFSDTEFSFKLVEHTVELLREKNEQFIENLQPILSNQIKLSIEKTNLRDVIDIISQIDSLTILADGPTRRLLNRIKLDVLVNAAEREEFKDYALSFLRENERNVFDPRFRDELIFSANFACALVDRALLKSAAIAWLIGYLKNSRVGGIDIIRNKIDEFLVRTSDVDVDLALIKLMSDPSFTLREASVDILSQKRNIDAYTQIITSIKSEKNIYVVRSMINALGRYENPSSCDFVAAWFSENKAIVKQYNSLFLCDVAIDFFKKFGLYHYSEEITRLAQTLHSE